MSDTVDTIEQKCLAKHFCSIVSTVSDILNFNLYNKV